MGAGCGLGKGPSTSGGGGASAAAGIGASASAGAPGGARRLTRLGLLIALGLALSLLERQLPPPAPLPGVRWGLANAATLAALALYGPGAAFLVWALRFLLVSLLAGSFFAPGFFVGGAGGLLAWAAMAGLGRQRWLGAAGVSVAGALAHHVGQVAAAAVVTAAPGVLLLLPPLLLLAPPVGLLTGALVALLLRRLLAAGAVEGVLNGWGSAPSPVRRSDLALAGAAVALALLLLGGTAWLPGGDSAASRAVVSVAGSPIMTLDLRQDGAYPIEANGGHMVVEVADGAVRVRESDCPDQVCVLTGWVREPGDLVVCVPYRVVVQVQGAADGGPDAILR